MKNDRLFSAYERFCQLMTGERLYLNPAISYESICSWLAVEPAELDMIVNREIGYSGKALMEHFREQAGERLRDVYGIDFCFGKG